MRWYRWQQMKWQAQQDVPGERIMTGYVDIFKNSLFPLNVYAYALFLEEGKVDYLHYGLFESEDASLPVAQQHSTQLIMERLPPPPCRILEVGIGLGSTLRQLIDAGYDVCGITPDSGQIHLAREKSGAHLTCSRFEDFDGQPNGFDVILFQESSQYIDPLVIFGKALDLLADNGHLIILDEVALKRTEFGHEGLHLLQTLLHLSGCFGFEVLERIDLSAKAAPTLDYLLQVVDKHRERIILDLGCPTEQIDALNASNRRYREKYQEGRFGYAFLHFQKANMPRWRLTYGGEACSDAMRTLFRNVFGHEMSVGLWQWKYSHPRGRSIVAWKNGEMVAHYGGIARTVDFFGEPRTAIQIVDVMVDPSERGVLAKKGSFYRTASTFFELNVGYGREYAASFGFPNERAMRLARTLGLYGEIDRIAELSWPVARHRDWWTTGRAIGAGDARWVNSVWEQMRADLKHAIVGVRDWDYIQYRYLNHPAITYDVIGVSSRLGRPLGVVVLKREGSRWELMDVIGALRNFPRLIRFARGFAGKSGAKQIYGWIADSFSRHFKDAGADIKDIGVSVASNISVFGPSIAEMERRWWLVSGDTDFK